MTVFSLRRKHRFSQCICTTTVLHNIHKSIRIRSPPSVYWNARTRITSCFWNCHQIPEQCPQWFSILYLSQSSAITSHTHVNGNLWMTSIRRPDFNHMQTQFNHNERHPKENYITKKGSTPTSTRMGWKEYKVTRNPPQAVLGK